MNLKTCIFSINIGLHWLFRNSLLVSRNPKNYFIKWLFKTLELGSSRHIFEQKINHEFVWRDRNYVKNCDESDQYYHRYFKIELILLNVYIFCNKNNSCKSMIDSFDNSRSYNLIISHKNIKYRTIMLINYTV